MLKTVSQQKAEKKDSETLSKEEALKKRQNFAHKKRVASLGSNL